jgi:hypothetical protein
VAGHGGPLAGSGWPGSACATAVLPRYGGGPLAVWNPGAVSRPGLTGRLIDAGRMGGVVYT